MPKANRKYYVNYINNMRRLRNHKRKRYGRYRKSRVPRGITSKTGSLTCFQYSSRLELIPSTAAAGGSFQAFSETFALADINVANLNAFTRLFKFWRIKGVKVTLTPKYIGNTNAPAGEVQPQLQIAGQMMTSITLDSNQLPPTTPVWANIDQAEEAGNLRKKYLSVQTGNRAQMVIKFKPRLNQWVRTDPASAVNATVALGQRGSWLSTGTSDTNYQGLRWAYEVNNPHTGFTIEVRKLYIFEFKGVN